jgi:predicted glutamine amidotransferase
LFLRTGNGNSDGNSDGDGNGDGDREGATVVASEPFDDDPRWTPVPDCSLVSASPSGTTVEPLGR